MRRRNLDRLRRNRRRERVRGWNRLHRVTCEAWIRGATKYACDMLNAMRATYQACAENKTTPV